MNIKKILSMLAALSAAICSPVYAADYPIKPITMIVPYPPGGPSDNIARALATSMAKTLKQAVVIDNVAGAGGTVGAAKAARSPKDGYY
jgi:tripartite-type tricarboxylate transporter receptor subunit TctC